MEATLCLSPRAMATLLVRLCKDEDHPVLKSAKKFIPQIRDAFIEAVHEAQKAVPMEELEQVLSLGYVGTGAPVYVLEDTVKALENLLWGPTPRTAKATVKPLPKVLEKALKASSDAAPLCVLESEKARIAKLHQNPAKKEWQDAGERNEPIVAAIARGRAVGYITNGPVDVIVNVESKIHGIEVKTLVSNKASKITMNQEALANKATWKRNPMDADGNPSDRKGYLHTIAIDDRDQFTPAQYSGHKMYYSPGVGSFNLGAMTPVVNDEHLRGLISGKYKHTPGVFRLDLL